ncbi:phosphatidate cytidylyltransferase [Sunxiuqinia sp. sy24]|uniref:phosphatidate cytidylyltransferase n=1 Tax=Sunxiuqinia sp. sy24 TaxID=3461495 RepID=UPI0040457556
MKNLFVRTLTGIAFTGVVIGSLLLSEYTFGILFLFILIIGLKEFFSFFKNADISPNHLLATAIGCIFFITFFLVGAGIFPPKSFYCLIPIFLLVFIAELYRKKQLPFENMAAGILGLIYIALPLSMISLLVFKADHSYNPSLLLALFIIIWTYDSGAYLFGMSLGKNRLFERISPKKSWEGAIGGAFLALVAAGLIGHYFIPEIALHHWLILAAITVVSATFGDLTESLFKRQFKLKDSSNFLPGHGGILDRFDSLFFAVPSVVLYFKLFV